MPLNFSKALEEAKRKAQLRGVPVSQEETAGIAEGAAAEATNRLATMKRAELERDSLEQRRKEHDDAMRQNVEDRKAAAKATQKQTISSGATSGAMLGYMAQGTAAGGVWGAVIGAGVGLASSNCIIITACTSRESYDVRIAREFRDKYMSQFQLGGYYALAGRIVPLIEKSKFFKLIVKRFLVDRLVDYGEFVLGCKSEMQFKTSRSVTNGFLKVCAAIGMQIDTKLYIDAHR